MFMKVGKIHPIIQRLLNSGEYRRKFDKISDNPDLNHQLYVLGKQMLEHRSGTLFEDMYWLDSDTAEIKVKELDGDVEENVD